MSATWLAALLLWAGLPVVEVNRAPFEIRESSRVKITAETLADPDGRGAIRIIGDGLTIELDDDAVLRGADADTDPDEMTGIGIVITGEDVTLRGGTISGYKVGVHAHGADGLTIDGVTLRDNFRQRLHSKPWRQDDRDRLDRQQNDDGEWMKRYGGGIVVQDSSGVTIRNVRVRETQNGILFDRVHDSWVYDNDASFLSGWGIALWRSTGNTISHNAFDFCVRGYSHRIYNRAHGAAAVLLTEQSSENVVAINSLTHGGAGIICDAGDEAVGRTNPRDDADWYAQRGSNENALLLNEISDAITYGVDLSFCRGTMILRNQINRNAIAGVRGRYVHGSVIMRNELESNGDMPMDSQTQAGVALSNGSENHIRQTWFKRNPVGLSIWSDPDEPKEELPWFAANPPEAIGNTIGSNRFEEDGIGMRLDRLTNTAIRGNEFFEFENDTMMVMDEHTQETVRRLTDPSIPGFDWPSPRLPGVKEPRFQRTHLRGRDHIVMLEWGPYDWSRPVARRSQPPSNRLEYEVYGLKSESVEFELTGARLLMHEHDRTSAGHLVHRLVIERISDAEASYRLRAEDDAGNTLEHTGRFAAGE
ncbi:MAG: hypothetical protein EA377_08325 [Phycisphaerales bacterium]|nr:MAG: hypothetical protein EA377_08325 [Phycisphaerales bacterium]